MVNRVLMFRSWHKTAKDMLYSATNSSHFKWAEEGQPIVIMQFTGLKDKNGKEIYEGDILSVEDEGHPFVKNWIGIVKFIDGSYLIENLEGTDGEYLFDELRETEVIGNIYENPELLAVMEDN